MQKRTPKHPIHGWINLYKPYGLGSTSAVSAVKRILRPAKIGHAGTLDPLAEGVLPLALGEATKTVPYMMDARKTYEFSVVWGEARSTDDAEGEVIETSDVRPSEEEIQAILPQFSGKITQTPPAFSAIKVDGKRAYDLARAGEAVELKSRAVEIFSLTHVTRAEQPEECATFRVCCSKGTYVRSLARDIAHSLGTVGYVSYLKRSAVGPFCEADAISLDFLEDFVHKAASLQDILASEWLLPCSDALDDIPALTLDATAEKALRHGQFIPDSYDGEESELAVYVQGKLVAIVSRQNGLLKPKRVFNL